MVNYLIYIVAISLQLSGALLLLCNSISTKRSSMVKSFAKSRLITLDGNTHKVSYNKKAFIATCESTYLNKAAFAFVAMGYFIGIFGEIGTENKLVAAILVFLFSGIEQGITYLIVSVICESSPKVTTPITYEELESLDLEVNQSTLSNDEIDKLMNMNKN